MLGLMASAPALDDPDGVAVGLCLRHRVGSEHAALAAAIVDHDRLLDQFRHALADHARDDVVGAAGRKRHDQPDRLGRKILRPARQCRQQHIRHAFLISMSAGDTRSIVVHDGHPCSARPRLPHGEAR